MTSNFSFSHSVFKRLVLQTRKNQGLFGKGLLLSSIYTNFNTLKIRTLGKHSGKGEIAQNEQFHLLPQCFLCNLYLKNHLIATFQLSSAASLNMGRSQNGVLGNGLTDRQNFRLAKIESISKTTNKR